MFSSASDVTGIVQLSRKSATDRDPTTDWRRVATPQINIIEPKIWLVTIKLFSRQMVVATNRGVMIMPDNIVRMCWTWTH